MPKQPEKPPEAVSVAGQKIGKLIEKAIDLLKASHGQELGIEATIKDLQEIAPKILQEEYVHRADAFVSELKDKPADMENIIAVKNVFLGYRPIDTGKPPRTLEEHARTLEKIAHHQAALDLLIEIKKGLYGPDGRLLKKVLLEAANDREKREVFFEGQVVGKCIKESWWSPVPEWTCGGWYERAAANKVLGSGEYGKNLMAFGKSTLKTNLETLLAVAGEDDQLDKKELTWATIKLINIVDYESLSWLHEYIKKLDKKALKQWLLFFSKALLDPRQAHIKKMFFALEPELRDVGHAVIESFAGKPLKDLTWQELYQSLNRLSALLKDEEHWYGPLRIIREYKKQ